MPAYREPERRGVQEFPQSEKPGFSKKPGFWREPDIQELVAAWLACRGERILASKKKSSPSADDRSPTFEESLEELERAVRELEEGKLTLSESLERYEDGVKRLKQCYRALESAERKIELLSGVDADGNPITEPFEDQEMTLDEKAAARTQRRSHRTGSTPEPSGGEELDTPGGLF
jgi:exodeoxyribonuclease VII small subunit